MSGHVGNLGYFANRLPRALAVVERRGRNVGEEAREEAIETLAALVDHALRQVAAPGVETVVLPGGRMAAPGGIANYNPDDDQSMISHINAGISAGVFAEPAPGREDRAGAPLPSSRIPYEDRGRTAAVVGGSDPNVMGYRSDPSGMGVVSGAGSAPGMPPLPPIPGIGPEIMQWLPTAIWAARKLVELVGQWRNR